MSTTRTLLSLVALATLGGGSLAAQAAAPVTAKAVVAPFAVTPVPSRLAGPSSAAVVAAEMNRAARTPSTARAGRAQSSTLMIVGGAAIVTGLLLDEGVITFVGAGVWLYGLYLYLR